MKSKNHNSHCKGRTKDGKRCRAAAMAGGLCFFHANPNRAAELGRMGGRQNRHHPSVDQDPLPKLESVAAIKETLPRLIVDLHAGRLNPKIAGSLRSLVSLQLRAIEASDLEDRVAKLERLVEDAKSEAEEPMAPELDLGDLPMPDPGGLQRNPGASRQRLTSDHPTFSNELPPNVNDPIYSSPNPPADPNPKTDKAPKPPRRQAIQAYASAHSFRP